MPKKRLMKFATPFVGNSLVSKLRMTAREQPNKKNFEDLAIKSGALVGFPHVQ